MAESGPRTRQRRALAALTFVATAVLWTVFFTPQRFVDRDAYDYAQIGRQIRQGHGYTTRQTFPRHLPYMQERQLLEAEWPSLLRYPVSPTLNAVSQLVLFDPVIAAVVQTGVCFLLSVPLFFLLAARLTSVRLASVATVFYVGDPRIWRDSFNGMTESVAILILLAILYLGFRPESREGRRGIWICLGLLCGLGYLARTQLVVLIPLGLVLAMRVRVDACRRSATLLLAGALLAIAPWLVRNYRVSGDPLFAFTNSRNLLAHTESHSGIDRYLHEPVEVSTVLSRYHDEIVAKVGRHLWPNVVDPSFWFEVLGVYAVVFPVVLLALVWKYRPPPERRAYLLFEQLGLALLLANFLLVCWIYHRQRYYDTMIPLLIIILVQRLAWMLGWQRPSLGRRARFAIVFLALALAGGRLGLTLVEHVSLSEVSRVGEPSYEALREWVDERSVVLSDLSAEVTLHLGNRTVRSPARPGEILEIDAEYLPIDYVLISQRFLRPRYRSFVESEGFRSRFKLVTRLPTGVLLFERSEGLPRP